MGITEYLRDRRVYFEILLHRPASCASRLAQILHVPGRQVAKAVLLRAADHFILAVLPATQRIDMERLRKALGVPSLRIAHEAELDSVFVDCEHGALPPFGTRYGISTVVDSSLAGVTDIVAEGNLRHQAVRLRYRDYEALEQPIRARFAIIEPGRSRGRRQRRAG